MKEAELLFRKCLEGRKRVLGEDHPATSVLINLAMIFQDQGKLTEAEPLLRQSLEKNRRLYGENHQNTLTC